MDGEMDKTPRLQSFPKSVFVNPMMFHNLENEYWLKKCSSHPEYGLLKPSEGEQSRPISSFSPQILREFHILLAEWRSEARELVACMKEKERQSVLASVGIQAFSEDVLSQKNMDMPGDLNIKKMSQRNLSTSAVSWRNPSFVSGMRKRKSTQLIRGNRSSKFGRPSNYPPNSSWSRKHCYNNSLLKRRDINKPSIPAENLKRTTHTDNKSQYLDEDDDEEEDQLTAIVSRQRQAFSARAAAGRPSIRKIQSDLQVKSGDAVLSTVSSVPAARRLSAKVLRAWKSLAKKIICKVARQRGTNRRDKIILAKRAARECARLLRQKALLSQKAARDSISRGHRLSREIASNWRSSTSSTANGSGPLTINGVTIPSNSNITHFSSLMDLPDYYTSAHPESGGLELNMSTSVMESSTAIRRRAEKAAAEQRKADLELLEARRQQRKLNFLITQTELYAHFMAKKMADVNSGNCKSEDIRGPENAESVSGNVIQEDDSQEIEAQRILRRLEEMDDDSVETKTNDEGIDTGSDISVPCDPIQNDQGSVSISTGSTHRKSYSSIAVAAKAAACRLGINVEEEYDIEQAKSEALMKVKAAVTTERNRVSQFHSGTTTNPNLNAPVHNNTDSSTTTQIETPKLFKGQLKAYQVRGLNWLLGLFDQGINGILADEMGLGKTVQTVAFLGCLAENYNIWGPFLIVTPASTLHNWTQEFAKFLPAFRLVPYWGTPTERKVLRRFWSSTRSSNAESFDESGDINPGQAGTKDSQLHVVITSYQVVLQDAKFINKTAWSYIVLDEAHAIKSTSSLRWKILLSFKCRNRLLLTGTPIQNTMQELWALLHFIMPDCFPDWEEFEQTYSVSPDDPANKMNNEAFHNLHKTLKPFLLRRVKKDVESSLPEKIEQILRVDMTKEQANIYRLILARNYDGLLKVTRGHKASFINIVMELKKCCNHAHLIAPPSEVDQQYLTKEDRLRLFLKGSGKGTLLDKLLQRLKSKGHRVLIFSQMVRMLDLIADYLSLRGWGFQRLDGSIRGEVRKQALDHFNCEGSTDFCFLLSTRAGGLGINLATADTVIIFDSDWNPQNDLQAQARAHRIGQTKQVSVYRFVTRESVEEKIIESATRKMVLDHLVIQRMDSAGIRSGRRGDTAKGHLLTEILRYGAEGLFKQADEDATELEVDIDDILNRAETRDTEATVESNPANALLSSFKVVNLDALEEDTDIKNGNDSLNSSINAGCEKTWDQIIPSEFRGQVKAEQDRKTLVELELGPRRRRPVKTFQAGLNSNQSSSETSETEENDKVLPTQLTEKEIRALVRAIRHFARPLERIDAIAADAELPDHSESELREVVDAVLKGCRTAMEAASINSNEESQKQATGGKGPVFQYGRVSVAARPLLQSLEYLETLHLCLPSTSKEARMSYELPFSPKLVAWSCNWDNTDDVRLLAGVYEHGYDNWETIKLDADLGLGSKLLPVSQTERPQANHLRSRVDYLLKMLAKCHSSVSKNTEQQMVTKKRRKDDRESNKSNQKAKAITSKANVKHTNKQISTLINSMPKSAEFVETDDSSSESDCNKNNDDKQEENDIDNDNTSNQLLKNTKQSRKSTNKSKIKSEKKDKYISELKPPTLQPLSSNHQENLSNVPTMLFTKKEEDEFRNMQGPIFVKCKKKFVPIKKHFKELEDLERTDEQNPVKLANVVLQIGDHIHSIVDVYPDKEKRHAWKNYLWEFVHIFSKNSTEELRHIYRHAVKRRLKEQRKKTNDTDFNFSPKHKDSLRNSNSSIDYSEMTSNRHSSNRDYYSNNNDNNTGNAALFRRYHTNRLSSHDRNDRHEQHSGYSHGGQNKYYNNSDNDWPSSITSSHKEFNRDRNNNSSRFDNAFNRPPGQSNIKHHKDSGSFTSQMYSPRVPSSHYHQQQQHNSSSYSSVHHPWTNYSSSDDMINSSPKMETYKYTSHYPPVLSSSTSSCMPESIISTTITTKAPSYFSSMGQCLPPPPPLPPLLQQQQHTTSQLSRDPRLSSSRR